MNTNLSRGNAIAIIAYACDPGAGSEPGAGAHLAVEAVRLASGAKKTCVVLTRQKHVAALEAFLKAEGLAASASVRAIGVGQLLARVLRDGSRGHSLAWQWAAYRDLRKIRREGSLCVAHHVTFASDTLPSAIHMPGLAGVRKIWGPVGSSDARLEFPSNLVHKLVARMKRNWFRFLAGRVDLVVAQTGHVAARLHGIRVDVAIEQNCIVSENTRGSQATRERGRGKPRVAFVGVLTERKRPNLAIQALRAGGGKAWDLVIIGDGPLRENLEVENSDLVKAGFLRFAGWLPHAEVHRELSRCVGVLHPSVREGAPWAIAEALAHGRWVVTVAGNGADYLVELVPAGGAVVRNDHVDVAAALAGAVERMLAAVNLSEGTDRWSASRFGDAMKDWYAMR